MAISNSFLSGIMWFGIEGAIPDRSIGKNKSLSRRNGKHAKSLRQRANNRKAMRKA